MSVRSLEQFVDYVNIRGTCVSTSFAAPSVLHVSIVHKFGLPNRHGIITCDDHIVHLRFCHSNDSIVYAWASPNEGGAPWSCLIS